MDRGGDDPGRNRRVRRRQRERDDGRRQAQEEALGKRDALPHEHLQHWAGGNKNSRGELSEMDVDKANVAKLVGYVHPDELRTYRVPNNLLGQRREVLQVNNGLQTIYNTVGRARRSYLVHLKKNRAGSVDAKKDLEKIADCSKEIKMHQDMVEALRGRCFKTPAIFQMDLVLLKK